MRCDDVKFSDKQVQRLDVFIALQIAFRSNLARSGWFALVLQ